MALTKILKEMAPELRDAANLDAGTVADARLLDRLRANGRAIPSGDYNQAIESGFYAGVGDGAGANMPPGYGRYGGVMVSRSATGGQYISQTCGFGTSTANLTQIYYRASNNNGATWGVWRKIITDEQIVGLVSQAGGVPTGAIVERGTNTNGSFVRFADGTQFCWHVVQHTNLNFNTAHGSFFYAAGQTWTFPAAFVVDGSNPPICSAIGRSASALLYISTSSSFGAFSIVNFIYHVVSPISGASTTTVMLTANGRWF